MTAFLGWAEKWSENPHKKEEQLQYRFKLQKLSHPWTVQACSCFSPPSPIVPFTQTCFRTLSQRRIKMHKWKDVLNAGLSNYTVFAIWSQTSLSLPACSFQNTSEPEKNVIIERQSIIYCLASSPFSEELVMGCTLMPAITKQYLLLCSLYYKYTTHRDTTDLNLQPDPLHINKARVILFIYLRRRNNSSVK